MNPKIKYRSGYKYQLAETYRVHTVIDPMQTIETEYITLSKNGTLWIKEGYAWDGPSGPTVDTPDFMRGSLVHDALYQLMRWGYLPESCRRKADRILRLICREDGMSWVRAWWVYLGVRIGAGYAAEQSERKQVQVAP